MSELKLRPPEEQLERHPPQWHISGASEDAPYERRKGVLVGPLSGPPRNDDASLFHSCVLIDGEDDDYEVRLTAGSGCARDLQVVGAGWSSRRAAATGQHETRESSNTEAEAQRTALRHRETGDRRESQKDQRSLPAEFARWTTVYVSALNGRCDRYSSDGRSRVRAVKSERVWRQHARGACRCSEARYSDRLRGIINGRDGDGERARIAITERRRRSGGNGEIEIAVAGQREDLRAAGIVVEECERGDCGAERHGSEIHGDGAIRVRLQRDRCGRCSAR